MILYTLKEPSKRDICIIIGCLLYDVSKRFGFELNYRFFVSCGKRFLFQNFALAIAAVTCSDN
jgi:hypothetical protein